MPPMITIASSSPENATEPRGVELSNLFVTFKPRKQWKKARTQDELSELILKELRDRDGLTRFAVAGYSLGGNLTMKLAGELGDAELPEVKAFAAVSPVI